MKPLSLRQRYVASAHRGPSGYTGQVYDRRYAPGEFVADSPASFAEPFASLAWARDYIVRLDATLPSTSEVDPAPIVQLPVPTAPESPCSFHGLERAGEVVAVYQNR